MGLLGFPSHGNFSQWFSIGWKGDAAALNWFFRILDIRRPPLGSRKIESERLLVQPVCQKLRSVAGF